MTGSASKRAPEMIWDLDKVNRTTAYFRTNFGYRDDILDVESYRRFLGNWGLLDLRNMHTQKIDSDGLRGTWVWPENGDFDTRIVYLHGGGYVGGGWLSHGSLAEGLAKAMNCAVFFSEYRLSPEYPYPGPLDDALAAYEYVCDEAPLGRHEHAGSVYVAGDSAGGGMAIALAMRCRDEGLPPPNAIAAMGAFFDLDPATSDLIQASGCVAGMAAAYAGDFARRHPHISPLYGDLSTLPPILLQTGTRDYLLQDTVRMAERLAEKGAPHVLKLWPDMPHVWQKFCRFFPAARSALDEVAEFFNLHRSPVGVTSNASEQGDTK